MVKSNRDIRNAVKDAGLYLWQVGDRMGCSDTNFARLLRKELEPKAKAKIYGIIDELKRERDLSEEAV